MFKVESGPETNNKSEVLSLKFDKINFSQDYSLYNFSKLLERLYNGEIGIFDLNPWINYYTYLIAKDYDKNVKDIDFKRVYDTIYSSIFNKIVRREITKLDNLHDLIDADLINAIEDAVGQNNKASLKAIAKKGNATTTHKLTAFKKAFTSEKFSQKVKSSSAK